MAVTGWWAEIFSSPTGAVLTLTGGVPNIEVTHDNFVFPSPATLTLAGSRPALKETVRPSGAGLTLTGGTPGVSVGKLVAPSSAVLTLTGSVPTVVVTDNKLITPSGAALMLTGGTPTVTVLAPVVIDQVGTPGSEGTGDITCSINPSSGADVVVFAWCSGAASSCYKGSYSGLPMKLLGRVKFNGGTLSAFLIENMGSGLATVTISKTGSDWAQCVAVSYSGAAGFKLAKVVKGSGTTASQSAVPPFSGRSIQSFTRPGGGFTSPSGGTNRINETSGFVFGTVSDTNVSATFSAALSSANWGGLIVDANPSAISTPRINYQGALWSELNGGTSTFTVKADVNDYIVVDVAQSGAGDPSSVTCAGTAMTLVDTQPFTHPNTGGGFVKRYRSAQQGAAGDKTISIAATGSQWWHAAGCSITNVTSFGTPTKASGTSSVPSHAVSCSAGQLILQSFVVSTAPTDLTGTNLFDSPGGSAVFLLMSAAEETTTFGVSNSMNWASMATVIT